jgi:predicted metal-binding transcription factor (methanogenesis marker protein 9)
MLLSRKEFKHFSKKQTQHTKQDEGRSGSFGSRSLCFCCSIMGMCIIVVVVVVVVST